MRARFTDPAFIYPALTFIVPIIVYLPTLWGGFYYDDNVIFLGHQVKYLADDPFLVFSKSTRFPGTPRSLHVFFLLLIYKGFGATPLPYHVFNLLFHGATCLLLYHITKSLTQRPVVSLMAGLLFGLHPVHVENITFVTLGGTDLFYAFWAALSLLLYLGMRKTTRGIGVKGLLLALSAGAFYLSILCKESAVAFVAVFPLTEALLIVGGEQEGSSKWRRWGSLLWALPHVLLLVVFKWDVLASGIAILGSGTGAAIPSHSTAGDVAAGPAGQARGLLNIVLSLGFFIKSLLLPYPLSPFIKEFQAQALLYVSAALFAAGLIWGIVRRRWFLIYGLLWFLVTSTPYLLVPFTTDNVAITAERYIYAPSMGIAVFLAVGLAGLFGQRKKMLAAALFLLLAAYGAVGLNYFYQAWRSEEAFWNYAVKMNPEYVSPYISLAGLELDKGRVMKARQLLHKGLQKPGGLPAEFSQAAYMLGNIAKRSGEPMMAETYYMLSLKYGPYEFSYMELGFLYLDTGNPRGAARAFENALRFRQRSLRASLGLALAYQRLGKVDMARQQAIRVYEQSRDPQMREIAAGILRAKPPQ